ncbi:fatty acid synthase alpha subunit Lsd1 [Coemansia sp. RSA 2618]|nr:fatty acid synthase alpha subunit Lsd1 [Coemansia sp. RSA 2618]
MTLVAVKCGSIDVLVAASLADMALPLAAEFTASLADATRPDIVTYAQFIGFCAQRNVDVAVGVFESFGAHYCSPKNIHINVVVEKHGLEDADLRDVLRGYYAGWALAPALQAVDFMHSKMLGVFGGAFGCSSGMQYEYIAHMYSHGCDIAGWAEDPRVMPSAEYLDSPAVALPLLGLVQLLRLVILAKTSGRSIGQLLEQFTAVTGHSHGLIVAAAVASAPDNDKFVAESEKALGWLMLFGSLPQIVSPQPPLHPLAIADSMPFEGRPSPMLCVQGAPREVVSMVLQKYNAFVKGNDDAHVYLSVSDTADQFIVSGNTSSMAQVVMNIRRKAAAQNEDQSGVPFMQRKPDVVVKYIDTSTAPLHCAHSVTVAERHIAYVRDKGWTFASKQMLLPVRSSRDGSDVRVHADTDDDVTRYLAECVYVHAASWPKALLCPEITHIADFAPVSAPAVKAIGSLRDRTRRNIDGRGIVLLCPDVLDSYETESPIQPFSRLLSNSSAIESWQTQFGPALVKTRTDGVVRMDTRLQRLTGMSPVMIGGLAPTTSHSDFIAAASRAGYLAELSIHDVSSEQPLIQRVRETAAKVLPGHGIALNGSWAASQAWLLHAIKHMCQDLHLPILGLCIDDAPSMELVAPVQDLHALGLRYVALKPQTVAQIRCVLEIADQVHPKPVMLQWFGGRTGGHHSFEEFHIPISQTYCDIRKRTNVVLVAGSGFGSSDGVLPYITGAWGEFMEGPVMPFDGVLLRSRVMVARESRADDRVKQLIVQAPGIDAFDLLALFKYDTPDSSGVVSVIDELGRPMHVLANRAARLCKDLSDWVFSQPQDKQLALLKARKAEIIARLNADYMRPWFGQKADSGIPVDLEQLTYAETVSRLVALMHCNGQWLHDSYRNFVAKFVERSAMRLYSHGTTFVQPVPRVSYDPILDEIETIKQCYSADFGTRLLASEDIQFFLSLCTRAGQKAVPFVPVLDGNFAAYVMRDSFWQMEDLEAVQMDEAEQRVLIPQGVVAAGCSTEANQPLADIMDGISQGIVQGLLAANHGNNAEAVPPVAYIGPEPIISTLPESAATIASSESERMYKLPDSEQQLPDQDTWISVLAGPQKCWLHALLTSAKLVHGARTSDNYMPRVLRPRAGRTFTVLLSNNDDVSGSKDEPVSLSVFSATGQRELDVAIADGDSSRIVLNIYHSNTQLQRAVRLEYEYHPETPLLPIHEIMDGRNERIRQFFIDMWLHDSSSDERVEGNLLEFTTKGIEVTSDKVGEYCRATGLGLPAYPPNTDQATSVPMDYMPILALPSMFKALTSKRICSSDLLHMVQTSNHIELAANGAAPVQIGDIVDALVHVTEISQCAQGKQVVMQAKVARSNSSGRNDKDGLVATIECTFVFLGASVDPADCFRRTRERELVMDVESETEVAILESKEWFEYVVGQDAQQQQRLQVPCRVEFNLESEYALHTDGSTFCSARTMGTVHVLTPRLHRTHVANIDFGDARCIANPVLAYLEEKTKPAQAPECLFEGGGYELTTTSAAALSIRAPVSAYAYSRVTTDHNPHNTNPYVADLTGLPGPLMQGLWTSAAVRQLIERDVAQGNPTRVRAFTVQFVGMVQPQMQLETQLFHVGMQNGRMLIRGQTRNTETGELVLTCAAQVAQPKTVYVFTGQGSQEPGMCKELYERCPAARAVCDKADAHMRERFGFSILDIIRDNPQNYTVHFGGQRGSQIRRNYMEFTRAVDPAPGTDGEIKYVPLFPEITSTSRSYTFQSPTGLLNATQFAQPAIMLFDCAVAAEMRSRGVFIEDATFAGHSLGEYGALAAFKMMTLEDIVDITFIRGMTMQSTVERDANYNSAFAMVAVNPSRVHKTFDEESLKLVIATVIAARQELLEIVNYNVRQFQYVVAGTRKQLVVLGHVLDMVHKRQLKVHGSAAGQRIVEQFVRTECMDKDLGTDVCRTRATIPIPGIDVPFHSSHLLAGAGQFRACINRMIGETHTPCQMYAGRYIPNLTAQPFDISREYFELMYAQTKSEVIAHELNTWPDCAIDEHEQCRLGRLMVIELLSYQFASPVRWIETQDRLINEFGVEQIIEIGPNATLTRMAEGSLMVAGLEKQVAVKHIFRDDGDIYYTDAMIADAAAKAAATAAAEEEEKEAETVEQQAPANPVPAAEPVVQQQPIAPQTTASSTLETTTASPDVPLLAVHVVRVVIAQKTKRGLADIPPEKSVKELTGGKSTLQNEILGDLLKEFGTGGQIPERPDEISLSELSAKFGSAFSGALGSYTSSQVSRMFSTKMPGSVSQSAARAWLKSEHGLVKAHQQDSVFLCALTMEPPARLGSKDEAHAWVSEVAREYARQFGVTLCEPRNGASSPGGGGGGTAASSETLTTVSSAELDALQLGQRTLAMQQLEAYARHLGIDLRAGHRTGENTKLELVAQQQQLDAVNEELGQDFVAGIRGVFDARKARHFDSYWNWAREDAYEWISTTLASNRNDSVESDVIDEQRLLMLANRTDAQLMALLDGFVALLQKTDPDGQALKLARRIREACAQQQQEAGNRDPVYRELGQPTQPKTEISTSGKVTYSECPREPSFAAYVDNVSAHDAEPHPPLVHLREKTLSHDYEFSAKHSAAYYAGLRQMCREGVSFSGFTALVTGCSRGSIAAQCIEGLLSGGARVIATTSSYSRKTLLFYEHMYKTQGSRGAELIVVPFNQGSASDVSRLVDYVFATLKCNVDFVLPFAAISEYGSDVSALGSRVELSARIMLTNLLRLLGEIKRAKEQRGMDAQPTLAVLPLSPNHGVFGFDGMYGETKAALETVFNRWQSESWGSFVCVAGAKIGWTRGTGLMGANNTIAQHIEEHGTRTFSTREMAFNLLGLLHADVVDIAQHVPVWADLNGGLQRIQHVAQAVGDARARVQGESSRRQNIVMGYGADFAVAAGHAAGVMHTDYAAGPLFNHQQHFARARSFESLAHLRHLQGMANLDKVVVVTGYGEIGPYGHAETRWEMEAHGEFSLEGCVELAWIMGLIKHHNGPLAAIGQKHYVGWVDAKSSEPVPDKDIKAQYEKQILGHAGIRLLEPELLEDQDPGVVPLLRELQIEHDMEPFEATEAEAEQFKLQNGSRVDVWANEADGSWRVRFLRGAVLMVPKALRFDRLVGAQLPTGWDPERYGIPKDVVDQVDMVTCYAIVATVEALVRSGITDPYELYAYFHVSDVGTSVGSGAGGAHSIRDLYHKRLTDKPVQSDILQETFVNTTPAWINMLLLSSAGAIKPPTGGCGTSVLSVDVAADTIRAGKARVMLAGGFEGFVAQGSYEFAQMGATSNTINEFACGRTPREMSRPTTSTRTGFVEAQGAGIAVLMSAAAAIEFGAPIYGIIAYSGTATDKQGHSLPAPGMGVLTSARQSTAGALANHPRSLRVLDPAYRKRQIDRALRDAEQWAHDERELLQIEAAEDPELASLTDPERAQYVQQQYDALVAAKLRDRRADALDTWGADFWRTLDTVSPLRGALAAWGLDADDIGLASFHGTATMANDYNESHVLEAQLNHLGRTPGHAVPAVCQKWLTGHPKGPAAAWMLNGALQSMRTGLVPGNRNADNIDKDLRKLEMIVFPSRSIQTRGIKAALLKSFGFGQVGAEILVVHADYLLATLDEKMLEEYNQRLVSREQQAYRYWQDTFAGNHAFVQVKSKPPFTVDQEKSVYLDPLARAQLDPATGEYHF